MTSDSLAHSHDLRLPDWGPYTKKYIGVSHMPERTRGLRFDLSVFPGYYRRQVLVPNAKWESGYHPWEAAPDLSYYSYRYELEWKDQVYAISPSPTLGRKRAPGAQRAGQPHRQPAKPGAALYGVAQLSAGAHLLG